MSAMTAMPVMADMLPVPLSTGADRSPATVPGPTTAQDRR